MVKVFNFLNLKTQIRSRKNFNGVMDDTKCDKKKTKLKNTIIILCPFQLRQECVLNKKYRNTNI